MMMPAIPHPKIIITGTDTSAETAVTAIPIPKPINTPRLISGGLRTTPCCVRRPVIVRLPFRPRMI